MNVAVVNSLDMFNQLNCMPVFSAYSRLSLVIDTTRRVAQRVDFTLKADVN